MGQMDRGGVAVENKLAFYGEKSFLPLTRDDVSGWFEVLDRATDDLCSRLNAIDIRSQKPSESKDELLKETYAAVHDICQVCMKIDELLADNKDLLREKRLEFHKKTQSVITKSKLALHARTWPFGYPGDHTIIEDVYRNSPKSLGVGYFLDMKFLTADLAVGIRDRMLLMRELLKAELYERDAPKILNIGCGSSREIFEIAPLIKMSGANVTCVDFDSEALNYSASRLSYADILPQVTLRQYNALRMISHKRNMKEFGPQDVIYSIGLLDYLEDNVLIRLLKSLYALLTPGGKLIAVFKDCDKYVSQEYTWMLDWDAFYKRTFDESRDLVAKAGIPEESIEIKRNSTGVIIFYSINKSAESE
ncbi:MAG: class I SAM-dependent methyltransferase [Proteobacteria bacterium]|nr:class I SAM-dependent methyltransferase [Pseudomonadota bacterium]